MKRLFENKFLLWSLPTSPIYGGSSQPINTNVPTEPAPSLESDQVKTDRQKFHSFYHQHPELEESGANYVNKDGNAISIARNPKKLDKYGGKEHVLIVKNSDGSVGMLKSAELYVPRSTFGLTVDAKDDNFDFRWNAESTYRGTNYTAILGGESARKFNISNQ